MKKTNTYMKTLVFLVILTATSCTNVVERIPPSEIAANQIIYGCSEEDYDDWRSSQYVLPYPVGESYFISLSHCSGSYHSAGRPDQYAIDFNMDIGTSITACRAGKVVHVEKSGLDGGFPNNLVVVQHSDGTYLQYMHLTHEGAEVDVGNSIAKGELIGYSGNTGLAGFPHLHLVATKGSTWQYPYTSFPITFSNTSENKFSLQRGQAYTAFHY